MKVLIKSNRYNKMRFGKVIPQEETEIELQEFFPNTKRTDADLFIELEKDKDIEIKLSAVRRRPIEEIKPIPVIQEKQPEIKPIPEIIPEKQPEIIPEEIKPEVIKEIPEEKIIKKVVLKKGKR